MPGTDTRLETGYLLLLAKVTLCLFILSLLDYLNQVFIGLSDISRMIERAVVKVVRMMSISQYEVFKQIFSFIDMSLFSYKKVQGKCLAS